MATAKKKNLVVTAPQVAVYVSGAIRYLDRGTPIPEGVDQDHIDALVAMNMVGDAKEAAEDAAEAEKPE